MRNLRFLSFYLSLSLSLSLHIILVVDTIVAKTRARIDALIRSHGGCWRDGPQSWLWRGVARLVGWQRARHPFRSPLALLRRHADRVAQAEQNEPQGHAAILAQMADAVRNGGRPAVTGRDARPSIAVIEAIYRSEQNGGAVVQLSQ